MERGTEASISQKNGFSRSRVALQYLWNTMIVRVPLSMDLCSELYAYSFCITDQFFASALYKLADLIKPKTVRDKNL